MNEQETRPESKYTVGEQVIPTFGRFKGKTGKIIEKAWGDSSNEWMYIVEFARAKHYYYDNELKRPK